MTGRGVPQLLKGSIAVSLLFVLIRFILTPLRMQVLTRLLSPADYGVVTLFSMSATAGAMLLSAGGFEILLKRLPAAKAADRPGILHSILYVSNMLAAVACVVILVLPHHMLGETLGALPKLSIAAMFILFLHIHQRIYYLVGCGEHLKARITQLLWSDAWFVAVLLLGISTVWTAEKAVWVWCLWLTAIILLTWRWVPLSARDRNHSARIPASAILKLGLPMLPLVLAEWTFRLVGQYVLLAKAGPACMALYALSFNIACIGYVIGVPLLDSLATQLNAYSTNPAAPPSAGQKETVSRGLRMIFAISIPVGLGFLFLSGPIIKLLSGPAFAQASLILPWGALVPFFLLINLWSGRLLMSMGKAKVVGAGSVAGAVVAVVLCLALAEKHSFAGVFCSVSAGLATTTGVLLVWSRIHKWIDWAQIEPLRLISGAVALALAFSALGIPESHSIVRVAGAAGITIVVALGFSWFSIADLAMGMPQNSAKDCDGAE